MGEEMNFLSGCCLMKKENGEYEKFCDVNDITEFVDTEDVDTKYVINWDDVVIATFSMNRKARKRLENLFIYGWQAKGHLRKQGLHKAAMMCLRGYRNVRKNCEV